MANVAVRKLLVVTILGLVAVELCVIVGRLMLLG